MTTEFDDIFLPLATELIDEFGRNMDFIVQSDGVLVDRKVIGEIERTYTVKVSPPFELSALAAAGIRYIPEDIVKQAKRFIILAAQNLPFTPALANRVQFNDREASIISLVEFFSGDEIAAYVVFVTQPVTIPVDILASIFATSFGDGPDGQILTSDLDNGDIVGIRGNTTGVDAKDPDWAAEGAEFTPPQFFKEVGIVNSYDFIQQTGIFTVYVSFITLGASGIQILFSNNDFEATVGAGFGLRHNTSVNELTWGIANGSGAFYTVTKSNVIADVWHELVIVGDGTTVEMFLDGAIIPRDEVDVVLYPVDSIQQLLIGIGSLAEVNPFEGKMGYCIIHGKEHDAETIAAQRVVYEALMLSRGVVLPIFQTVGSLLATSFADGPDGQTLTSDLNAGSFTGQRGSTTDVDDNDPSWVDEGASFDDEDHFENVGSPDVDDFSFVHNNAIFTIYLSFFIDSDSTGFDTFFDTRGDGTDVGITAFWRRDTGAFTLIIGYASGSSYEVSFAVSDNAWHSVIVVGDGADIKLYIDDAEFASPDDTESVVIGATVDSQNIMKVGVNSGSDINRLKGKMGYLSIHDTTHSEAEITSQRTFFDALMALRGVIFSPDPEFQVDGSIYATSFDEVEPSQVLPSDLDSGLIVGTRGSTSSPASDDPSWVAEGAEYDGFDFFSGVGDTEDFRYVQDTGIYTIYLGFLAATSPPATFGLIFDNRAGAISKAGMGCWRNSSSGNFRFIVVYNAGSSLFYSVEAPASLDAWHGIVIVGDGSTVKLYLDGAAVASPDDSTAITIGAPAASFEPLRIGRASLGTLRFKGKMGYAAFHDEAHDAATIAAQREFLETMMLARGVVILA